MVTTKQIDARLTDLEDKSYLKIIYFPEEISETFSPNYQEIEVIGRSVPIFGFSGTSGKELSFSLIFFAMESAKNEVYDRVKWLQSHGYPRYSFNKATDVGIMRAPAKLELTIGSFLDEVVLLKSCDVTWSAPYDVDNGFPLKAEVSLSFSVIEKDESVESYLEFSANRIKPKVLIPIKYIT